MTPGRGRVLLRRVESGESYPGGTIIIPETVRDALMAQHAEVVAVGAESICDDDDCSRAHHHGVFICATCGGVEFDVPPLDPALHCTTYHHVGKRILFHAVGVKSGDWVLVAKRAGVECGDDTGQTYLATIDDVLAVLEP